MVLIIIVCVIACGVCYFKQVDFVDTLFIGFTIGIVSILVASLTQTKVKTETYKNVNYPPIAKKMFILLRRLKIIFLLLRNKIWRKEKIF